jgi:hypothetical protein
LRGLVLMKNENWLDIRMVSSGMNQWLIC